MAESITRSEKERQEQAHATAHAVGEDPTQDAAPTDRYVSSTAPAPIIWTPPFIALFFLVLVSGLSLASVLTQGWLNGYYAGAWVLLAFTASGCGGWLVVTVAARTPWARIGGIFGCIWAIFQALSFLMSLLAVNPQAPIIAQLNAAASSALLGCYVSLSINRTAFRRWDAWFFRLAFILGACAIALIYFRAPAATRSPHMLETIIASAELSLCIFVWWLRPSCWKTQPAPAFFFGIAPAILLLLVTPGLASNEAHFFFTQVALLSILLAVIRTLQGELCHMR